jgi:hypothetical protein
LKRQIKQIQKARARKYKINPNIQPTDPKVALEVTKANMAGADDLMKAGVFKHHWMLNPGEGLIIAQFSSKEEALKVAHSFWPRVITEIHELVSWEKTKEIVLEGLKDLAEK